MPRDVPTTTAMDIEDALAEPGEIQRADAQMSRIGSLEMKVEGEELTMSRSKADLIELASIEVRYCFRTQELEATEEEVKCIAAMQVELDAAHVIEAFSPRRYTEAASRMGLRPGFAVDLCEPKPYGPNKGQLWDLSKDSDIEELDEMIDYEKPSLLSGSPPCHTFCALRRLSNHKRDRSIVAKEEAEGRRHLHTGIRFYRKQCDAGRYFLHEHPDTASSYKDPEMQALQALPGVYAVSGPKCRYDMQVTRNDGTTGVVYKMTKYVTNSPHLAAELEGVCANTTGGPWHVHTQLLGGLAWQYAKYPPKMVKAVLRAQKAQLKADGSLSALDFIVGGPVPNQPLVQPWDDLEEVERFLDDFMGQEQPPDNVKAARAEEIAWCRSLPLYRRVPRAEMVANRHKTTPQ